jgi:hypothetical protein
MEYPRLISPQYYGADAACCAPSMEYGWAPYETVSYLVKDDGECPTEVEGIDWVFARTREEAIERARFDATAILIEEHGEDEARGLISRLQVRVRRFA